MVLAGLIVVTQVDANKDPPDLPFVVAGTENTRLLWQRLLQSYGQSWRSRLTIVPLISAISPTDTSTPSKSLEIQSALLADSTANPNYVSANYSILPSAFAPLVFYYNLPELSRDVKITLSLSDISDIFTGKLRYWSDVQIRQRNPDLPFIGQPIHLILRDDNCSENIALTEFLCNSSDIWQLQYGLMSSMQDFKAPSGLSVYHTILPSGGFNLVNSVPYSIAYFLGTVPSLTAISLQLQNGITVNVSGFECNKRKSKNDSINASEAIYPLVYTFYIIFRKDLPATPYNVTVLAKDPLRRFSTACRLQVELYRFLHWLTSSESSEILKFHGFCQIKGENMLMDLNEMSCRNSRDLTVSAEKLANEETHLKSRIWGHFVDSKEDYRDVVFTLSTTVVILFVVSVVLTYYLCSHHHPISEYIIDIEKMDPSGDSDAFQTSLHDFQMKNAAFLEYAFENNSDRNTLNPYCASKNCGKSAINTWVYAVSGQYKGADVLLKPTNIRSTMKFMEKGRLKLQKYTAVDHENVQLFYGLAKSSVTQNKIRCSILAAHLKGMRKK